MPRFAPGQSGNPRGRKAGSRHRATLLAERLLEGDAAAVVRAVVAAARDGDMAAGKLVLDRVLPIRKARVRIDLPSVTVAADVPRALAAVLAAVASGQISADEAAAVAGVIEAVRKGIETETLEARITALEAAAAKEVLP